MTLMGSAFIFPFFINALSPAEVPSAAEPDEHEGEACAHLRFEARFDPLVFPKTAKSIEEHVFNELGGGVLVTAVSPGSLSPPGDKFE